METNGSVLTETLAYHRPTGGEIGSDEQIRRFLETLYGDDDVLEVRFIGEVDKERKLYPHSLFASCYRWRLPTAVATRTRTERNERKEVVRAWPETENGGIKTILRKNAEGYNAYIGVNPRWIRLDGTCFGTVHDIERVACLHADIDNALPEQVEAVLNDVGLKATVIVLSNEQVGGCHVYMSLRDTETIPSGDKELVAFYESLNRRFISVFKKAGLKADDVQDLPRILRLPGVQNIPDKRKRDKGRVASPCILHSCDPAVAFSVREIDSLLPPLDGLPTAFSAAAEDEEPDGDAEREPCHDAPAAPRELREKWAREYAESVGAANEGQRHRKTFAVAACCLNDQGLPVQKAAEIVSEYNGRHCAPPLDGDEIDKQVRDAERYGKNPLWNPSDERNAAGTETHTRSNSVCVSVPSPKASESRKSGDGEEADNSSLPEPEDACTRLGANLPTPQPDLWDGIVTLGGKLFLGGHSKSRKSFSLIAFALAVSRGAAFWGRATPVQECDPREGPAGDCGRHGQGWGQVQGSA